jgi:hypothetical protein
MHFESLVGICSLEHISIYSQRVRFRIVILKIPPAAAASESFLPRSLSHIPQNSV